jgi:hypothetical protein
MMNSALFAEDLFILIGLISTHVEIVVRYAEDLVF